MIKNAEKKLIDFERGYYQRLWESVLEILSDYAKQIGDIGFAAPERGFLARHNDLSDPTCALEILKMAVNSSAELCQLLERSPAGVLVTDKNGLCQRSNKTIEKRTALNADQIYSRSIYDLMLENSSYSSVHASVYREKRHITATEVLGDGQEELISASPVFDKSGTVSRVMSCSILLADRSGSADGAKIQYPWNHGEKDPPKRTVIIGNSQPLQRVMAMVDQIKDVDSNILITGETGVGKSMLARYIHENSYRHNERLVEINCGAIPEALLESELFGYESGAFTGADKRGKPGLIELANRGTVFLDEISELPLPLQVKVLHFLQNKSIIRVGGTKNIQVDARVITASNKRLDKLVGEGKFRSDLYYRINVIPLEIPPLRQRKEDIRSAADHFFQYFNHKYNRQVTLDDKLIRLIENYPWPGNMRELENYIERLIVIGKTPDIVETLYSGDCSASEPFSDWKSEAVRSAQDMAGANQGLAEILEEVEKQVILSVYDKYHSSYKVAKQLDISQSGAYRKISKYRGHQ